MESTPELLSGQPKLAKPTGRAKPVRARQLASFIGTDETQHRSPIMCQLNGDRRFVTFFLDFVVGNHDDMDFIEYIENEARVNASSTDSPANVLVGLNQKVCTAARNRAQNRRRPPLVSCFCSMYDLSNERLQYATAGQYVLLVQEDGSVRCLDEGGPALGVSCGYPYLSDETPLNTMETLIVYNEGFSRGGLSIDRVVELVRNLHGNDTASARDRIASEWARSPSAMSYPNTAMFLFGDTASTPGPYGQNCMRHALFREMLGRRFASPGCRSYDTLDILVSPPG